MSRWLSPAAVALVLLQACGSERLVIGEAPGDAGPAAALELDAAATLSCPEEAAAIPASSVPPALLGSHLGSWLATLVGAEAAAFPSARVQLRLVPDAPTLRFESGTPVPPLLDPAAGYLCTSSVESCASAAGFVSGFDYRLAEPRSRGSILSFELFLDEPWDAWCRGQTPVERTRPGCEPSYGVERAYDEARWGDGCAVRRGDEWTDMPCDRLATVERQVCACGPASCRASARVQPVHLRLLDARSLEGALWFSAERAQALLFSRVE